MPEHRENIINLFKRVAPLPRAIVLGNDEGWSDEATLFRKRTPWLNEFSRWGVDTLENETRIIAIDNRLINGVSNYMSPTSCFKPSIGSREYSELNSAD